MLYEAARMSCAVGFVTLPPRPGTMTLSTCCESKSARATTSALASADMHVDFDTALVDTGGSEYGSMWDEGNVVGLDGELDGTAVGRLGENDGLALVGLVGERDGTAVVGVPGFREGADEGQDTTGDIEGTRDGELVRNVPNWNMKWTSFATVVVAEPVHAVPCD